ncbi:MAG: GNAT family N-acetyltransferase [Chloroflexi bacterium]|nr:GNAT family N-acetyltransferase [Chloroflexota bacterium]MDA1173113.1 GNAT family N-acetyltransferase [Chloroflexota bacterium]
MTSSGITIRSFTWSDVALLATLQHADESDVDRWLRQSNLTPEQECVFAEVGGKATGFGYLIVEQGLSRGVLIAEAEDPAVLSALVSDATTKAQTLGLSVLQLDVPEDDQQRRDICEAAGMSVIRTHLHLLRPGDQPTGITLPAATTTRLAARVDVATVTNIQNAAFTGSWGYSPNNEEEIAYRIFELPSIAPDPVVIVTMDGQDLGYCWAHQERVDSPGMVDMVGVLPHQQGKGLGKLVTAVGIDHLISIGATPVEITVDSENGPAIHVYESVGFRLHHRSVWYERALS